MQIYIYKKNIIANCLVSGVTRLEHNSKLFRCSSHGCSESDPPQPTCHGETTIFCLALEQGRKQTSVVVRAKTPSSLATEMGRRHQQLLDFLSHTQPMHLDKSWSWGDRLLSVSVLYGAWVL